MAFSDAYSLPERMKSFGDGNANYQTSRATIAKVASSTKEADEAFRSLSDDTLKTLMETLKEYNALSVKSGENLIRIIDKTKAKNALETKAFEQLKKTIEQTTKHNEQQKQEFVQLKNYNKVKADNLELDKRLMLMDVQKHRNAVENMEKHFFGPMEKMFKGSHAADFARNTLGAFNTIAKGLSKDFTGMLRAGYSATLSVAGNAMVSSLNQAAMEAFSDLGKSLKEVFSAFREGTEKGKEQYIRREQEKLTKKQDKIQDKFDKSIEKFRTTQERSELQLQKLVSSATSTFNTMERDKGNKGNKIENALAKLAGGITGKGGEGGGLAEAMKNGLKHMTGVLSSVFSGALGAVSVISNLILSVFGKLKETFTQMAELRAEAEKELFDAPRIIVKQVGVLTKGIDEQIHAEFGSEQFGIKPGEASDAYIALIKVYGRFSKLQIDAISVQAKLNHLYGFGADEGARFMKTLDASGVANTKNFESFRAQVTHFANIEGVSWKLLMKDVAAETSWIASVGSPRMVKEFALAAAQLKGMGVNAGSVLKAMSGFESFEGSVSSAFEMNAALGSSLDPVMLHTMAMTGNMKQFKKEVERALGSVQDLNVFGVRALAKGLGMSTEEIRNWHEGILASNEALGAFGGKTAAIRNSLINRADIKGAFAKQGITDKDDQEKYINNRLIETFKEAKDNNEKLTMSQFLESIQKNDEFGSTMMANITKKIAGVPEIKSMADALSVQMSRDDINRAAQLAESEKASKAVEQGNSIMMVISQLMYKLLEWALDVATPLLSGIARFFELNALASSIDVIGKSLGQTLRDLAAQEIKQGADMKMYDPATYEKVMAEAKMVGTEKYWEHMGDKIAKAVGDGINKILHPPSGEYKEGSYTSKIITQSNTTIEQAQKLIDAHNTTNPSDMDMVTKQGKIIQDEIARQTAYQNAREIMSMKGMQSWADQAVKDPQALWAIFDILRKTDPAKIPAFQSALPEGYVASAPWLQKAAGGFISGPGGPKEDKIPAMLSNGEYVMNANAVKKIGLHRLNRLNHYSSGGIVENAQQPDPDAPDRILNGVGYKLAEDGWHWKIVDHLNSPSATNMDSVNDALSSSYGPGGYLPLGANSKTFNKRTAAQNLNDWTNATWKQDFSLDRSIRDNIWRGSDVDHSMNSPEGLMHPSKWGTYDPRTNGGRGNIIEPNPISVSKMGSLRYAHLPGAILMLEGVTADDKTGTMSDDDLITLATQRWIAWLNANDKPEAARMSRLSGKNRNPNSEKRIGHENDANAAAGPFGFADGGLVHLKNGSKAPIKFDDSMIRPARQTIPMFNPNAGGGWHPSYEGGVDYKAEATKKIQQSIVTQMQKNRVGFGLGQSIGKKKGYTRRQTDSAADSNYAEQLQAAAEARRTDPSHAIDKFGLGFINATGEGLGGTLDLLKMISLIPANYVPQAVTDFSFGDAYMENFGHGIERRNEELQAGAKDSWLNRNSYGAGQLSSQVLQMVGGETAVGEMLPMFHHMKKAEDGFAMFGKSLLSPRGVRFAGHAGEAAAVSATVDHSENKHDPMGISRSAIGGGASSFLLDEVGSMLKIPNALKKVLTFAGEKSFRGLTGGEHGSDDGRIIPQSVGIGMDGNPMIISDHAKGTMPGGSAIPGFISTNGIDALNLHKNESVQVMNAQQRVERDTSMEQLTNAIMMLIKTMSGQTIEVNNVIDNNVFQKLIISLLRQASEG